MQLQRLRRLAVYVLFAWLFALTTGIVNACVVQADLHNSAQSVAHGDGAAVNVPDQARGHEAMGHDHESDHTNAPCERFCDEPSVMTQAAKQQSDSTTGFWLASASAPSFYFPAASDTDAARHGKPNRWRSSIPISIAFLRLTL